MRNPDITLRSALSVVAERFPSALISPGAHTALHAAAAQISIPAQLVLFEVHLDSSGRVDVALDVRRTDAQPYAPAASRERLRRTRLDNIGDPGRQRVWLEFDTHALGPTGPAVFWPIYRTVGEAARLLPQHGTAGTDPSVAALGAELRRHPGSTRIDYLADMVTRSGAPLRVNLSACARAPLALPADAPAVVREAVARADRHVFTCDITGNGRGPRWGVELLFDARERTGAASPLWANLVETGLVDGRIAAGLRTWPAVQGRAGRRVVTPIGVHELSDWTALSHVKLVVAAGRVSAKAYLLYARRWLPDRLRRVVSADAPA